MGKSKYISDHMFNTLLLYRSKNLGTLGLRTLFEKYECAEKIIHTIKRGEIYTKMEIKLAEEKSIHEEIENTIKIGGNFFLTSDLKINNLCNIPPILVYSGNINLLYAHEKIAIVGTREPTILGLKYTAMLCEQIDHVTISGLAKGIDAAVHNHSLNRTIAIIPGGLDKFYPEENFNLQKLIEKHGLIITDKPIGFKIKKENFPQRNNLIASLCSSIIVVECQIGSGALITAKYAKNYDKTVFVVPSHPLDQMYSGNLSLFTSKIGTLFLSAKDLENTNYTLYEEKKLEKLENYMYNNILKFLSPIPVHVNDIVKYTNLHISTVLTIIGDLELQGKIHINILMEVRLKL